MASASFPLHQAPEGPTETLPGPQPAQEDAFLGSFEGHVGLLLDIALVHGLPFEPDRRRAELATLFAALTGRFEAVRALDPAIPAGGAPEAIAKAFTQVGLELLARGHPAIDPPGGLPLRVGLLCIQRRHLARLAIAYHAQGALDMAAARRLHEQSTSDTVLLIEALAALASAFAPLDPRRLRVCLGQVTKLQLPRDLARRAREAVRSPRSAAALAKAAPLRLRGFLLEQLLLAEQVSGSSPSGCELLKVFAEEAQIPPDQVAALAADAAELHADQRPWLAPGGSAGFAGETPAGPQGEAWELFTEQVMDRVATAVTENLEAIVTEMKETGELGQLLAKAAAGRQLTREERSKVKAQLLDLAKAVPALAIFAAPGGALLLPLLAKLLPFNVLPSAWGHLTRKKPAERGVPRPRKLGAPG